MEKDKNRLLRFFTGKLPERLKERESFFFEGMVRQNSVYLGVLSLLALLVQAISFLSVQDMPIMQARVMQAFSIIVLAGFALFAVFFFLQARRPIALSTLWICQIIFILYYVAVDLSVIYLNLQVQESVLRLAPLLMLASLACMTGVLSAISFALYLFIVPFLTVNPYMTAYSIIVPLAGYLISRIRHSNFIALHSEVEKRDAIEKEKDNIAVQFRRITTWDEELRMNNRRAMSSWLEAIWPLCIRNKIPVAVMMLSPDHMDSLIRKGDEAIANARMLQFADLLKPFVRRQSDFLGRYDKYKFMILFSGLTRTDAEMLTQRLQKTISEHTWKDDPTQHISFAIGAIHDVPTMELVAAQWVTRADTLLKKAHMTGEGQSIVQEIKQRY